MVEPPVKKLVIVEYENGSATSGTMRYAYAQVVRSSTVVHKKASA